ncbi:helix-turn-helix domain-containing protein [Maribacter sp. R86514]|uniref:helix-turn-helix domain-containing protein n=1 Tax=Maribacter sp. R86514 TaxID=3093854 RepID=UPI0037C707EB
MNELNITTSTSDDIVAQIQNSLKGRLLKKWGESIITFNNSCGKGTLRTISFERGVSFIDCNIKLNEDVKVVFQNQNLTPIEFIFISEGYFKYSNDNTDKYTRLEQFQNTIISHKRDTKKTFLFPKDELLKINFIRVDRKEYLQKKNNNVSQLNQLLVSLFNDSKGEISFQHEGNFSLRIADEIKLLNDIDANDGMLRSLSLEGRLYIILSLQLLEHKKFEENMNLPEAISKEDILKIHKLTTYILEHISDNISISALSTESGLSPKKLQLGFKVLYSKTVNEYVRQLKLEISKDYLKNSDLSISEIVYAIGIKSRSYFSKIFFETYGILPTEYRKHIKNKNAAIR